MRMELNSQLQLSMTMTRCTKCSGLGIISSTIDETDYGGMKYDVCRKFFLLEFLSESDS